MFAQILKQLLDRSFCCLTFENFYVFIGWCTSECAEGKFTGKDEDKVQGKGLM